MPFDKNGKYYRKPVYRVEKMRKGLPFATGATDKNPWDDLHKYCNISFSSWASKGSNTELY